MLQTAEQASQVAFECWDIRASDFVPSCSKKPRFLLTRPSMPPTPPTKAPGRLIGLDYGRRRIGVAVSDPDRCIASPLEQYERVSPDRDARYFQDLAAEHDAAAFVVGVPVHLSGAESEMAAEARRFGQWLAEVTGQPVHFWDERYTTAEAERHLQAAELTSRRRRARRDMLAAQILLQAYLDRGSTTGEGTEPLQNDP
jgi:putative Holliday junction resolvase